MQSTTWQAEELTRTDKNWLGQNVKIKFLRWLGEARADALASVGLVLPVG